MGKIKIFKFLIPLFISVLILYFFLKDYSFKVIQTSLFAIGLSYIIFFILLSVINTFLRAYRYQILTAGKIDFRTMFLITLVRNFSVDLLPARSASIMLYTFFTKKRGLSVQEALFSFFVAIVYDLMSLSLMLGILLLFLKTHLPKAIIFIVLLLMLFLSLVFLKYADKFLFFTLKIGWIKKTKKIKEFIIKLHGYFKEHNQFPEKIRILIISFLIRVIKYFSLFVLFLGFTKLNFSLGLFSIFSFGSSAAEASALFPIQGFAGFGTFEAVFTYVFTKLKVNLTDPFLTGFSIHLVTQLWEYSIGLIALIIVAVEKKISKK